MNPLPLLPQHDALLNRIRPGARAFVAMLLHQGAPPNELAMFGLDLRSLPGLIAGVQLLGADWVETRTSQDPFPVVVFPIAGQGDVAVMVQLVAPSLMPVVGRRPTGTIEVILVDREGEAAMAWLNPEELLRDCG